MKFICDFTLRVFRKEDLCCQFRGEICCGIDRNSFIFLLRHLGVWRGLDVWAQIEMAGRRICGPAQSLRNESHEEINSRDQNESGNPQRLELSSQVDLLREYLISGLQVYR
jgi:hypothetical protein